jgi:hypothetical protein
MYGAIGMQLVYQREQPNQAKIEARHYINEPLAANQTLASHGENRGSSPLGSAMFDFLI